MMKTLVAKIILQYLKFLTKHYVKRQKAEFIGLTGSVGKTTLTLAIHAVLSKKFKTAMTYREGHGLNSETGLPFAILGVHVEGYSPLDWLRYLISAKLNFFFKKCPDEKFVLEMGVDKPDDMTHLLSMVEPKVGVFLSLAKVHGENFQKLLEKRGKGTLLDLIFEEKAKLIYSLGKFDTAVLNADDQKIIGLKKQVKAGVVTFGLSKEADICGVIEELSKDKIKAKVSYKGKQFEFENKDYFLSEGTLRTFLAAFAVGVIYEIGFEDIISALESLQLPPGRMSKIEGIENTLIIDSSYNSSKPAMFEALDNLVLFKGKKKVAVLGDMRELGLESKSEHEEVAERAIKVADEMVLIGPAMRDYFMPKAIKLGFAEEKIHYFDNTWKALDFINEELIKGGEVILVKGSQNTLFLEIIVEGLMKDKLKADELLCRRGGFWDGKREGLRI